MRKLAFCMFVALAVSGCTTSSEEEQLENAIRENLSNQGTVEEVELTKQDEDNLTGHVVLVEASGRRGRLNCTAQRRSGSNFDWRCSPAIDEQTLQEMENIIRTELSAQATVVEVDMRREGDDDHMSGHALLEDANGNPLRVTCTAERDSANVGMFNWQCAPENAEGGG
jgi:hypothetical protein